LRVLEESRLEVAAGTSGCTMARGSTSRSILRDEGISRQKNVRRAEKRPRKEKFKGKRTAGKIPAQVNRTCLKEKKSSIFPRGARSVDSALSEKTSSKLARPDVGASHEKKGDHTIPKRRWNCASNMLDSRPTYLERGSQKLEKSNKAKFRAGGRRRVSVV